MVFDCRALSWPTDFIGPGMWNIHKMACREDLLASPRKHTRILIRHVDFRRKRDGEADLEEAGSAHYALVSKLIRWSNIELTTRIIVAYLLNYL